jgi:hypothetical protein
MSVILPGGPAFQFEVDNLTGTPVATTPGTSLGSGASNADGTAVSVLGALSEDIQYLIVGVAGLGVTTTEDNSCLLDILTDPAGGTSWGSFIDDIGVSRPSQTAVAITMHTWFHFPVSVLAGTSVGARCRKNGATASTGRIIMFAFGQPRRPEMWWCGQGVETLGAVAASSKGTSFTPGNTGANGTFATIGTSTRRYGAIQLGICSSDSSALAVAYHVQIGVSSAVLPGTPTYHVQMSTAELMVQNAYGGPIFVDIPTGTVLQVRGTCSGTAEALTATLHGVY